MILAAAAIVLAVAIGPAPLALAAVYGGRWLREALTPPVVVVRVPVPVPKYVEVPLFVRVPVVVREAAEPAPAPRELEARPILPERGDLVDIKGTKFWGLVVCFDPADELQRVWCRLVKSASIIDGTQVATCEPEVRPWPMAQLKIIDRGTPVIGATN